MIALVGTWWAWLGLALVLATIEVLVPGFIFLGIALGAALVALLQLVLPGIFASLSLNALSTLFGGLSLISWIALRKLFQRQTTEAKTFTQDVND